MKHNSAYKKMIMRQAKQARKKKARNPEKYSLVFLNGKWVKVPNWIEET